MPLRAGWLDGALARALLDQGQPIDQIAEAGPDAGELEDTYLTTLTAGA